MLNKLKFNKNRCNILFAICKIVPICFRKSRVKSYFYYINNVLYINRINILTNCKYKM